MCICEEKKSFWKKGESRLGKDREETTPRIGQNDDISQDNPDYRFGYIVRPQPNHLTGAFGGNQGRPYPRPVQNPLQGHPSNGILVGPGGPTGVIGRPRPYYNNGFGGNGYGIGGFPQQGYGLQGFPGQAQGFPGQGLGFGGGLFGQQGFGGGAGGFGAFGNPGFPNLPNFAKLRNGPSFTSNNLHLGRRIYDDPGKDSEVEVNRSEKLTNKISDKI